MHLLLNKDVATHETMLQTIRHRKTSASDDTGKNQKWAFSRHRILKWHDLQKKEAEQLAVEAKHRQGPDFW